MNILPLDGFTELLISGHNEDQESVTYVVALKNDTEYKSVGVVMSFEDYNEHGNDEEWVENYILTDLGATRA